MASRRFACLKSWRSRVVCRSILMRAAVGGGFLGLGPERATPKNEGPKTLFAERGLMSGRRNRLANSLVCVNEVSAPRTHVSHRQQGAGG